IGDEVQLQGAQELSTYLSLTSSLETLIPVMNDMIAQQYGLSASGENAVNIATMLGKVMNGQTGALSRLGYSFDEAQEKILKTGTEMERAAVLADVVNASVEGMNAALRDTASGAGQAMLNTLGDMKEQMGSAVASIMPYMDAAASVGITATSFLELSRAVGLNTLASKALTPALAFMNAGLNKVTVATFASARAMGASSVAAKVLAVSIKGLLISTGVGAAIWALGEAVSYLMGSTKDAAEELGSLKAAEDAMGQSAAAAQSHMDSQAAALKKLMDSGADTTAAVEGLNREYGAMFGQMKTAAEWYDVLIKKSSDYAKAMGYQAALQNANTRVAEIKMQQDYWHNEEKRNRTGRYSGTTKHNERGKEALKQLTALREEEAKLTAMITSGEQNLAALNIDTSLHGAEWAPESSSAPAGKGPKVTVEPVAPEGSLKKLAEDISNLRSQIDLAVDPRSRLALQREMEALERQKRHIEFDLKMDKSGLAADLRKELSSLPMLAPVTPLAEASEYKGPKPEDTVGDAATWADTAKAIGNVTTVMTELSRVTDEAAGAWLNWAASTISAVAQALPQIAALIPALQAKAAGEAASQNAAAGPFGWIAGIAAMASVIAAFATLPKFAEGGVAYGPTLGLFGEYPGAANNPEVVAPLSRLESLLRPSDGLGGRVTFTIEGRALRGVLQREEAFAKHR
ncbi:MAG: hypothetical protein NC342_09170, partial [Pseudoflavonifractor sp.]|nr:hypothetical protein [Alloprevotella sp.]MCM1117690.1 hypothetical protein [Pseudoflavonifractor sp.]